MEEQDRQLQNIMTEGGSVLKAKTMWREDTGTIPIQEPILQRVLFLIEADLIATQVDAKALLVFLHHHAVRLVVVAPIQEAHEAGLLAAQVDQRHEAEITKRIQIQSEDDE